MSWTYQQSTGEMTSPMGIAFYGYSGQGDGKNNPEMQSVPKTGPIPVGVYSIGSAYTDKHLGPCVMHLDPMPGTDTFGRSLFRIHGDNPKHDYTASEGCIIMGPVARPAIAASLDKILTVIE